MICTAASLGKTIKGMKSEEFIKGVFPNIAIIKNDNYLKISNKIDHKIVECDGLGIDQKMDLLSQLIELSPNDRFIVFTQKTSDVTLIANYLNEHEAPAIEFHSDLNDNQRVDNLYRFKSNQYAVLVCSDSANRGIHFDFDTHVVQFESAKNAISLLHRFGRTGRLGEKGNVVSMITQ